MIIELRKFILICIELARGQRDDVLARLRVAKGLIEVLEESMREAKTLQQRASAQDEISRQKQTMSNLRARWRFLHPGKPCPV